MLWLLGVVCLGGGLYLVYSMVSSLRAATATRRWPMVQGTIIRTWVEHTPPLPRNAYCWVKPKVSYRFEVDGKAYTAEHVDFNGSGSYQVSKFDIKLDEAERFLAKFPVGAVVTVYHNPRVPSLATLEVGQSLRVFAYGLELSLLPIIMGVFLLILAVLDGGR